MENYEGAHESRKLWILPSSLFNHFLVSLLMGRNVGYKFLGSFSYTIYKLKFSMFGP